MKYALIKETGLVFAVLDREPASVDSVEITDEQAGTIRNGLASGTMHKLVDGVLSVYTIPVRVKPVQLSKLSIRRKLRAMGKESAFDAFLTATPTALSDWNDAQFLLSNDPIFTTYAPYVKGTLELTDEQFDTLLQP